MKKTFIILMILLFVAGPAFGAVTETWSSRDGANDNPIVAKVVLGADADTHTLQIAAGQFCSVTVKTPSSSGRSSSELARRRLSALWGTGTGS